MHISTSILLLVGLASVASTAVADEQPLVRAPFYRRTTRANWIRNRVAMAKRDGQSTIFNDQGSQYLLDVNIGTPGQTFTVAMDTGSADLWVPSSQCPASQCPFSRFNSGNSSSFQSSGSSFNIQYGIGSVNGTYAIDTVSVGGINVSNQQFGLATSTADILTNPQSSSDGTGKSSSMQSNGILGLGYPQLTAQASKTGKPYNPVVFNMVSQNLISQPVFSIYMNSLTADSGEIVFGGVDNTKFTGNLVYLPVVAMSQSALTSTGTYYYWMVYGQSIGVTGGQRDTTVNFTTSASSSKTGSSSNKALIFDTGTTLTYLPTAMAEQLMSSITSNYEYDAASGVYAVDCALQNSNASFVLSMASSSSPTTSPVTLTIPVSSMVIPVTNNVCMFGLARMDSTSAIGNTMYLIGDSFLRSAYLVFDMGQNRIGIAAANGVGGSVNGVTASSTSAANTLGSSSILAAAAIAVLSSALFF
ncbi:aspartic peptidase domain-containing protein [Gongronella butleri]|nr:aspartic peptidase domain-containing protein [Gongronella butleri]